MRRNARDTAFDVINYAILATVLIVAVYPLYFVVIASVSEPSYTATGRVWLMPRGLSIEGYQKLYEESRIWIGYRNTVFYAVLGTSINLALTLPAAYALSRRDFRPRRQIAVLFVFTMLFYGGLIPTYLVVKHLGMTNTIWAMVVPNAVTVWNLILARSFFEAMPAELAEAAYLDGCSNTRLFVGIILPLSRAMIAVIALYYAVMHWNAFFSALIYLRDQKLYPLQMFLREILIEQQAQAMMLDDPDLANERQRLADLIKYAIIIVSALPVLIAYPFAQKYFARGVMLGSVKG